MCFENSDEIVPFDESIDPKSCCKCYHRNYYEKFTCCPGVKCTLTQCEQCCEDEYNDGHPHSDCCCNTNPSLEPPCAGCSILFCPIAMVIDVVSMPFRFIDKQCYNCKNNVKNVKNIKQLSTVKANDIIIENVNEDIISNEPSSLSSSEIELDKIKPKSNV